MKFTFDVVPMGAVRVTHRGRNNNPYARQYMAYKRGLNLIARSQYKGKPLKGALIAKMTFYMPLPKNGVSQKRKVKAGDHVTTTPDIDNLQKTVLDGISGIAFTNDNQISEIRASKIYRETAGIEVEVYELGENS
jgi:Holliday junction resolvase RusA-like endonuclease